MMRIGRGPDVGPLKMRAAGILVARSLNQCEPPRIEDAPKTRQARVQPQRRASLIGADLEDCPAGIASTGRRA